MPTGIAAIIETLGKFLLALANTVAALVVAVEVFQRRRQIRPAY